MGEEPLPSCLIRTSPQSGGDSPLRHSRHKKLFDLQVLPYPPTPTPYLIWELVKEDSCKLSTFESSYWQDPADSQKGPWRDGQLSLCLQPSSFLQLWLHSCWSFILHSFRLSRRKAPESESILRLSSLVKARPFPERISR